MHMYQFKLTKSETYFYHMVMNMCQAWSDEAGFNLNTKKYYPV